MTADATEIDTNTGLDPEIEAKLDALHAADKAENEDTVGVEIEIADTGEIEIVDLTHAKEPEAKPEPSEEINNALADLKARLETSERDRANESRRAAEAEARANASAAETHKANLGLIENAVSVRKSAIENAKARMIEAKRAQDYEYEAEIQSEMIRYHAELTQLEAAKTQYERALAPQPAPQRNSDPVEQMASDIARAGSPRSAEWIRSHPEYARDQRLLQKMLAAHNLAEADGIQADTDEYFAAIEGTLGIRKATPTPKPTPAPAPRAAPPPAAPAGNGTAAPGSGQSNPNRIRLSAAEVEIANEMGMTPQEYARNKLALQKEGKLSK